MNSGPWRPAREVRLLRTERVGDDAHAGGHWFCFFRRRFTLLPDREELSKLWQALVENQGITGFRAHDARLVAAMQSYGVTQLLTFNFRDFRGMPIMVLDPATL